MKLWIRLLIGTAVGVLLGLYLPESGGDTANLFSDIESVVINVGRYALFPMVLFGLAVAVSELKALGRSLSILSEVGLYTVSISALTIVIGFVSVLLLSPERIPMIIEEAEAVSIRPAAEYLRVLIPRNLFRALVVEGRMLLPVVLLALLVGFNLDFDRSYAPVLQNITDALSRLFYRINALVTEVIAIGLIALAASLVFDMRSVQELELFQQLFIVLSFTTVFIVLVIFPLALYFVGRVKNPAYWLYGMIAPAITAVFSTDSYFALGTLTRVGKDNFGIPRNVGSPAFSLVTVFGRSGSAMVIASSFLLLLRSYSSLEITVGQALWVLLFTFLVSFTLGSFPGSAVTTGLAALCALYGQGMEEAFLILRPAAAVLLSLGTFVDVMTAGLVGFLVSERRGMRKNIYPEDFV